jgi:ribonuclease P protein subunit RPR2
MSGLQESYFAMPLELDNDVVGVLVVTGIGPPEPSVLSCTKRLGSLVDAIALAVDRLQTLAALGRREEEVIALYRQLNAFALDFRSTYAAERARAKQLAESVARLARTYHATVRALAMVAETKDERTAGHLQRVSRYGMLVTDLVAPEHGRDAQFEYGFLLHDVGKLTLPDGIFTKEGPLTDAEWELVREHPSAGRSILEDIDFLGGACEIVYSHHERWDGTGYPRRLRGTEIPLGARIFAVCDAFEAMTSDRPYRPAVAMARALGALRANAGGQFWPDAVEAFLSLPAVAVEAVMAGTGGSWP